MKFVSLPGFMCTAGVDGAVKLWKIAERGCSLHSFNFPSLAPPKMGPSSKMAWAMDGYGYGYGLLDRDPVTAVLQEKFEKISEMPRSPKVQRGHDAWSHATFNHPMVHVVYTLCRI